MAEMEFKNKSYFTTKDIEHLIPTKSQIKDVIYAMRKKGRIVSLNKNKYFIVPMKSRIGSWTDEPFVIADEMMNSSNYYIGGWASANYWRLTDQIPSKF